MKAILLFFQKQLNAEKICLLVIRWGACLALFAPLVVSTKFFFPFVAPKAIFFRITVEIILAAYILLVAVNRKYLPRITPLTVALTIFLEIFILASLAGVNFERSFWSTFERMTGLWTLLHLYAFFIILTSCFRKRGDWQIFLGTSVLAGAALSLYFLTGDLSHTRSGATIGNSSFMAAYLLFDIFFALILFLSYFPKKGLWPVFFQIFFGTSLILMVYVLFNASAQGALFFFVAGTFLMALGFLFFYGRKRIGQAVLAVILISAIGGTIFLISHPDFLDDKIAESLSAMKSRFIVWQISLKAWQERFILGWGPENFQVPFSRHFNPCLFTAECGSEIWFDRAHNIIFDTAVTTGLAGLISYLAVFAAAFWEITRFLLARRGQAALGASMGMAALLLAYFGQNVLVFDTINTFLVFFLSLAFIGSLNAEEEKTSGSGETRKLNPILIAAVIAAIVPALWFGNVQPAIAAHYTVRMIVANNVKEAAEYFKKSLDTLMYKQETREIFAQRLGQEISGTTADKLTMAAASELAEWEMEKGIKKNPLDFRQHLFLSKLYTVSYQITGSKEKLNLAEDYAKKALELSPTSQQAYWQIGEVRLAKGDSGAISYFKKAIKLESRYLRSYWYLAMAYKYLGQYELAREELLKLKALNYEWDKYFSDLMKVVEVFQAVKDYEQLIPLYQRILDFKPNDIQAWGYLAASYYQLGRYNEAGEVALKVKEKFPELSPQMENYLKILPK